MGTGVAISLVEITGPSEVSARPTGHSSWQAESPAGAVRWGRNWQSRRLCSPHGCQRSLDCPGTAPRRSQELLIRPLLVTRPSPVPQVWEGHLTLPVGQ